MAGGAWNEAYPQGHDVKPPRPTKPTTEQPGTSTSGPGHTGPKTKWVTITTDEDGDKIRINGENKGTSPLTIQLRIGVKYTITAVLLRKKSR